MIFNTSDLKRNLTTSSIINTTSATNNHNVNKIDIPPINKEKFEIVSKLLKKDLITAQEALILLEQEVYEKTIYSYQPYYGNTLETPVSNPYTVTCNNDIDTPI